MVFLRNRKAGSLNIDRYRCIEIIDIDDIYTDQ